VALLARHGPGLAHVWIGDEAMVRNGRAVRCSVPPDVKYADRIGQAQNEARASPGVWASGGFGGMARGCRRVTCAGPR
jgi:endonuclease YncB( thermonuclease family)